MPAAHAAVLAPAGRELQSWTDRHMAQVGRSATLAGLDVKIGDRVEVLGADFIRYPITVGVLDAAAVAAYTNGQCHALAIALSEATGWPMLWAGLAECIWDEACADVPEPWGWCDCQVHHLAVARPDGAIVDVEGVRTREAFLAAWADHLEDYVFLEDGEQVCVALEPVPDTMLAFITGGGTWRQPDMAAARLLVANSPHLTDPTTPAA